MSDKIVIVGAGPAGSSTAIELAKHGIRSTVIDEAPTQGGVIYRGPWRQTAEMPHLDEKLTATIASIKQEYRTYSHLIDFEQQSRVLGPLGMNELLVLKGDRLSSVEYDRLVLATGCQERSVPFPGWQLPGVMLLGGIQLQIKSGLVRPGNKVVVAGTGPLLVLVACQLSRAGCDVIGVYEAAKFGEIAKEVRSILNRPQQALQGLSMLWYLKKQNIPVHYGWGLVEAKGDSQLQEVTVAPYDEDWVPEKSEAVTLRADTLGVGYGFTARSQLAQLMDLEVDYDHMSGTIPRVDSWQRSSRESVFCIGDTARIAGADAAVIEGKIAALALTSEQGALEHSVAETELDQLRRKLSRFYRFRYGFDSAGYRKPGLLTLPNNDTVICRCEQVTKQKIEGAIEQGCRDMVTLKMRTRVTMGDCQGKTCSHYCYDRLKQEGFEPEQKLIRPRFPLDQIPFAAFGEEQ